jgi:hypothetical protein
VLATVPPSPSADADGKVRNNHYDAGVHGARFTGVETQHACAIQQHAPRVHLLSYRFHRNFRHYLRLALELPIALTINSVTTLMTPHYQRLPSPEYAEVDDVVTHDAGVTLSSFGINTAMNHVARDSMTPETQAALHERVNSALHVRCSFFLVSKSVLFGECCRIQRLSMA